jgi:hypothetical protein
MAHVAITIEGGLFSADLLERLGSRPDEVPGQRPTEFDLDGARLSEEIQEPSPTSSASDRPSKVAVPATRAASPR